MNNIYKRILTSIILFTLLLLIIKKEFFLICLLLIFGIISIIEFSQILRKIFKKKLQFVFFNLIFIFYISVIFISFFILTNVFQLKIIMFILLFGCIASDIGGYIFGKFFKGPKLTKISPNKTFAGAIGSLLLTTLTMFTMTFYLGILFNLKILILSLATSTSCQLGDLLFSYLKRKAKLKDTGNFLPGHGGLLDRLDGILLGIPVGFIIFLFIY